MPHQYNVLTILHKYHVSYPTLDINLIKKHRGKLLTDFGNASARLPKAGALQLLLSK